MEDYQIKQQQGMSPVQWAGTPSPQQNPTPTPNRQPAKAEQAPAKTPEKKTGFFETLDQQVNQAGAEMKRELGKAVNYKDPIQGDGEVKPALGKAVNQKNPMDQFLTSMPSPKPFPNQTKQTSADQTARKALQKDTMLEPAGHTAGSFMLSEKTRESTPRKPIPKMIGADLLHRGDASLKTPILTQGVNPATNRINPRSIPLAAENSIQVAPFIMGGNRVKQALAGLTPGKTPQWSSGLAPAKGKAAGKDPLALSV